MTVERLFKSELGDVVDGISEASHITHALQMMAADISDRRQKNALAQIADALQSKLDELGERLDGIIRDLPETLS